MPRGPVHITPAQRAASKANTTARNGVFSGATNSDFTFNNLKGYGGMNNAPRPKPKSGIGRGRFSPKARALQRKQAAGLKDKITDLLPANVGHVDNSTDPTSALSMLRRKAATRQPENTFMSDGKFVPYRNDRQKNGYK